MKEKIVITIPIELEYITPEERECLMIKLKNIFIGGLNTHSKGLGGSSYKKAGDVILCDMIN